MFRLANRFLFAAVAGVLVALVGVMVLGSNGMFTILLVVVLAPLCVATIVLQRIIGCLQTFIGPGVHPRWIQLDCLPPYPTRSGGE
jgi:hypothetical protein